MTFDTIFDITQQPYPWYYPAIGFIIVIVGAMWSFFRWDDPKDFRRWMPHIHAGFAAIWIVTVFAGTFPEWLLGRRAVRNRTAMVVEGPVENFVPMPFQGHGNERFTVGGVAFSYSAHSMSATFENKPTSIWAGRYVRVHYLGNAILKLEVASETPQ